MDQSALWDEIGKIYLRIASYDDAVAAFSKAIELNAKQARYYSDLASAYSLKGKNIEAIALYHKCLELPGSDGEKIAAWNRLADIYGKMDDYRNAASAYARAAELSRVASDTISGGTVADEIAPSTNEQASESIPADQVPPAAPAALELIQIPAGASAAERPSRNGTDQDANLAKRLAAVEAVIAARMAARAVSASTDGPTSAQPGPMGESISQAPQQALPGAKVSTASVRSPESVAQPADGTKVSQPGQGEGRTWGLVPTLGFAQTRDDAYAYPESKPEMSAQSGGSESPTPPEAPAAAMLPASEVVVDGPAPAVSSAFENGSRTYFDDPVEVQRLLNELATYRRITDIAPLNDRAWDRIGRISKDLGQYADAIDAFQRAINIAPDQADYYYHLGLVYAAQKRYEDAIASFLRTVDVEPGHILAHCAVAGCYVRLGQAEDAEKHIDVARPEMVTEKEYNRACFEAICGNVDLAIELLRVALKSKQTTMTWVRCDPDLDFIRGDPRFQALVTPVLNSVPVESGLG